MESEPRVSQVIGHLDFYAEGCLRGWAFDEARPDRRVEIEVLHRGAPICVEKADLPRSDLAAAGHGDGRHGFEIAVPLALFDEPQVALRVRVVGQLSDLMGSPVILDNRQAPISPAILKTMGQAIVTLAESTATAEALDDLAGWLIQHFDVVYQRQALLAASKLAERAQFDRLLGSNMALSEVMRHTASAVVDRYPRLALPEEAAPEISIIIAAHNHFAVTYECLKSIALCGAEATFEVIMVDDASLDETLFAPTVLTGGIRVIRNARNLGFLRSAMAGRQAARGRLLVFLNNDCVVHEGWLDALVETFAREPTLGVAGSKLLFPDGSLQEAGGIIWRGGDGTNYGRGEQPDHPRYCFMRDADYVSGASLMIPAALFDAVGGFSDEFAPGYFEDTDLCFKVRAAQRRVVVQPGSIVTHHEGTTSGTNVNGTGMKRFQRVNQGVFLRKWREVLQAHAPRGLADPHLHCERGVRRRLLFIDVTVPTPDRDAGSGAAFTHMRALQRMGFKVSFVGADNMAKISPYTEQLEACGIEGYYRPYFNSVEEIFQRAPDFDVIYVHRFVNMTKYAGLIRLHCPQARLIYNMADLHHLRLEREAGLTQSSALALNAAAVKRDELAMVSAADSVIVHSSHEAQLLRATLPSSNVHVVPWSVASRARSLAFEARRGIAFVGGYNHTPNVDAALWLVQDIMPLVWADAPEVECLLIGADMPACIRALEGGRVRAIGYLPTLEPTLMALRLTVAPLRFGAGLKGKVLTSLAAGLPCVSTPCAIEGMELPPLFDAAVAATAESLAARIVKLYQDEALNEALGQAGLDFVSRYYSDPALDSALQAAFAPPVVRREKVAASAANSNKPRVKRKGKGAVRSPLTTPSQSPMG